MQFFKHQSNMRHDPKIAKLIKRYGLRGYGIYNLVLEAITESLASDRPMPELEISAADIAELYNDDTVQVNEAMAYMINNGLFELNEINGRILCTKIYRYLDKSQTRSKEIRNMIENYKVLTLSETCPDRPDIADRSRIRIEVDKEAVYQCEYFAVDKEHHEVYQKAYQNIDILSEYNSMYAWLKSNPKRLKSDYPKFINNWLQRASSNKPKKQTAREIYG